MVQLVQAGSSFHLLQGDSVLSESDVTSHPYEAGGLQEESLQTARCSDAVLSFRRKIVQFSHQQRVLGGQGTMFLQDLVKIADGQSVIFFIIPGICAKRNNNKKGI